MATRIEILSFDDGVGTLRASFFYPVPTALVSPSAREQTLEPAAATASKLAPTDLAALANGDVYEQVVSMQVAPGTSIDAIRITLLQMWAKGRQAALDEYATRFAIPSGAPDMVGTTFDDKTGWK
jgi:hypothetical protein